MNSKENLVFLGMMGSGKSSIGSLVSKKLNIDFIDVDSEIEKKIGLTISKIFENKGEKYFRQIEEKETLKFLKSKKTVISLGGGAFLNDKIDLAQAESVADLIDAQSKSAVVAAIMAADSKVLLTFIIGIPCSLWPSMQDVPSIEESCADVTGIFTAYRASSVLQKRLQRL